MRNVYAGTRLPVVGFSNDGSLRTKQLDMDEDGKVLIRERNPEISFLATTDPETAMFADILFN